jgi:hypothetical protein
MYGNLSVLVIPFGLFGHLLLLWDANKGNEIRVLFFFSLPVTIAMEYCSFYFSAHRLRERLKQL